MPSLGTGSDNDSDVVPGQPRKLPRSRADNIVNTVGSVADKDTRFPDHRDLGASEARSRALLRPLNDDADFNLSPLVLIYLVVSGGTTIFPGRPSFCHYYNSGSDYCTVYLCATPLLYFIVVHFGATEGHRFEMTGTRAVILYNYHYIFWVHLELPLWLIVRIYAIPLLLRRPSVIFIPQEPSFP